MRSGDECEEIPANDEGNVDCRDQADTAKEVQPDYGDIEGRGALVN